ncbi:unnamed protein product [Phytomonas sp. EM1]|nr:unnamed protein product [Phytomonas sp. EM1]|eukprot:CCW60444.1 unnamed protein product [Phytomonas sp. isolate EM1]
MLRPSLLSKPLVKAPLGLTGGALLAQRRGVRYANIQETLKPIPGQSAGQMSILNEICCNPDAEEERRKPVFRLEVMPRPSSDASTAEEDGDYLRKMHRWGYDSLTLFRKTNEDPGPWWNANSSTLISNWAQVGDYANAGMWSGVWRYTYGIGEYNLRPHELRGRAWGKKDPQSGAVSIRYGNPTSPLQRLVFPHTKEHEMHRRLKNPENKGFSEISALHGKRVLREVQYHLGNGLRFYLVDGVFGSDPKTCTPYRIITDNPTHAYFTSLAAIRKFNYVSRQEITLVKRVSQSPIDEWAWRRPGVLVYHAPGYDFEAPRIVEEFGGPRPKDMGLSGNRFLALEPYSIPMKAVIGGEPSCEVLLDTVAFLCARWGFYADDKGLLTLPAESVLSPRDGHLTLVVAPEAIADRIRTSPYLYGSRHHRIGNGVISRAWDVASSPLDQTHPIQPTDLIEEDLGRVQRGLPTRMGLPQSLSHRLWGRRHVSEYGFKWPHNYTEDVATKAYTAGHLFNPPKKHELEGHKVRPSGFLIDDVEVVVIGEDGDPAEAVLQALRERATLYAEEAALKAALDEVFKKCRSVKVVPESEAGGLLETLAEKGQM